jgi:DNA-binding Lrp family transcriptional regulator
MKTVKSTKAVDEILNDNQEKVRKILEGAADHKLSTVDIANQINLPTAPTSSILRSLERRGIVHEHKTPVGHSHIMWALPVVA